MPGYVWMSFWDNDRISLVYPLISHIYPLAYPNVYLFFSHHLPSSPILSKYILWSPQWSPNNYPYISTYLSIHLLLLLHRCPSISTSVSIHLSYFTSLDLLRSAPSDPFISKNISFKIHWSPTTYPKISSHWSCWIFDLVSAGVQRQHRFTQAAVFIFSRLHW